MDIIRIRLRSAWSSGSFGGIDRQHRVMLMVLMSPWLVGWRRPRAALSLVTDRPFGHHASSG